MRLLDTSIKIGEMELKNRLVMPPMAISKADSQGRITEQTLDYYNEKSSGGFIGLIITEHSYISREGKAGKGQLSIAEDSDIQGLKRIVSIVHQNGSKIMAQINHAGGAASYDITGLEQISASPVKLPEGSMTASKNSGSSPPREMNTADIEKVKQDFTSAALRAKAAGYDGVEIHSAHGYLLNQFYSPLTNKRTDIYNGYTITGRIRLHLEIIRSIRKAVGRDYPVALRLGACDYMTGGTTLEDSVLAAREFEKAGIDLLDISGGFCGYIHPSSRKQGYFGELSKAVKENVSVPVILTGGVNDAENAESLLEQGKADLIGVGRAILKDSGWAKACCAADQEILLTK